MKWVLLLGLVVSLANGRTIFDYERDGLDNEQQGIPGKSVTGKYEWRAPDGRVTEVSYVADHLGFRLLEDLELQPPSNPFIPSPAESTAQASTKTTETDNVRAMEEEEEEEEEENETAEQETEEEEETEEEDENAEGEAAGEEEEGSGAEEEEQETEAKTTEAEGAESTEPEEKEADATANEEEAQADATANEKEADDNAGKSLDKANAAEQEIAKEGADVPQKDSAVDNLETPEPETAAEPTSVKETAVLVPVNVQSIVTDEAATVLEPTFVEETPIIATAEIIPVAEPMVTPVQGISSAFTSETQMLPRDDVVIDDGMTDTFTLSDASIPAPEALPLAVSLDNQQIMSSSVDTMNPPSDFPGAAIVFLGPFPLEGQESSQNFEVQNDFDREVRTFATGNQDQGLSSNPISNPVVEVDLIAAPIATVPQAEPLLQPIVDVSPTPANETISVLVSEVAEVPASPESASLSAFENSLAETLIVARHIEAPEVRFIDIEPEPLQSPNALSVQAVSATKMQKPPSVPVSAFINDMPQHLEQIQVIQALQDLPVDSPPLPLPLAQVQLIEIDVSSGDVEGPVETNPNLNQNPTVFVREIDVSEANNAPEIQQIESSLVEIQLPQHRFKVTKSGRSMDSAPVLVDKIENDFIKNLYFIPESFQVSDSKSTQSAFQVEVPVPQEEMIIKAKSFTQPEESLDLQFVGVSTNELEKPISTFSYPSSDSVDFIPVKITDPNPAPLQVEAAFVPVQGDTFQEPDTVDSLSVPVQFVEVPASAFDNPEPESYAPVVLAAQDAAPAAPALPQLEAALIPVAEDPSNLPENFVFIEMAEPSAAIEQVYPQAPSQEPPLLPPLMKVSRILNQ